MSFASSSLSSSPYVTTNHNHLISQQQCYPISINNLSHHHHHHMIFLQPSVPNQQQQQHTPPSTCFGMIFQPITTTCHPNANSSMSSSPSQKPPGCCSLIHHRVINPNMAMMMNVVDNFTHAWMNPYIPTSSPTTCESTSSNMEMMEMPDSASPQMYNHEASSSSLLSSQQQQQFGQALYNVLMMNGREENLTNTTTSEKYVVAECRLATPHEVVSPIIRTSGQSHSYTSIVERTNDPQIGHSAESTMCANLVSHSFHPPSQPVQEEFQETNSMHAPSITTSFNHDKLVLSQKEKKDDESLKESKTTNSRMKKPKSTTQCHNCKTERSPLWRKHPENGKSLCNKCGLFLQRYKKDRPIQEEYMKAGRKKRVKNDSLLEEENQSSSPTNTTDSHMHLITPTNKSSNNNKKRTKDHKEETETTVKKAKRTQVNSTTQSEDNENDVNKTTTAISSISTTPKLEHTTTTSPFSQTLSSLSQSTVSASSSLSNESSSLVMLKKQFEEAMVLFPDLMQTFVSIIRKSENCKNMGETFQVSTPVVMNQQTFFQQ
nr:unnamed protein product [Naegleria fowleri]